VVFPLNRCRLAGNPTRRYDGAAPVKRRRHVRRGIAGDVEKHCRVSRVRIRRRAGWFIGRRSEPASFDAWNGRAIWSRRQHVHPRRGTLIAIPLPVAWVSAQCRIHFRRQLMPLLEQAEKAEMRNQVHQPAKPISDQSFPRISTGSRFRRFTPLARLAIVVGEPSKPPLRDWGAFGCKAHAT